MVELRSIDIKKGILTVKIYMGSQSIENLENLRVQKILEAIKNAINELKKQQVLR